MEFNFNCACGATLTVPEAQAGTQVRCPCGRAVPVPSLLELRKLADLPLASPELVVERLLAAGMLPEETACVLCGVETEGRCHFWTRCERAVVRRGGFFLHPITLLTALLGLMVFSSRRDEEYGRDRLFRLPLRVCSGCRPGLRNEEAAKAALVFLARKLASKSVAMTVWCHSSETAEFMRKARQHGLSRLS